jgi:hypothetical protein
MSDMRVNDLFYWVKERHAIYTRRAAGHPKPWTNDPILRSYRFCNVYRELDTVTQWITANIRTPYASHPDLWFNLAMARLVNLPESLAELGYFDEWSPNRFITVLHSRREKGKNFMNSAYIVSTNGVAMDKAAYLADRVLTPLWVNRASLRPQRGDSLGTFANKLNKHIGMGTFLTGQVVADLKYVEPLKSADDWWVWAMSGPGSRRGLNYVLGRDMDLPWVEKEWHRHLMLLADEIAPLIAKEEMPPLHAQDLQNCLCELSKWAKVKHGLGRPKSTYPGS